MGCEVYANGHEIACKKGDNKVIAKFPDVCLSPPSPPAGPIPVPYPNTSFSKDMQKGSKTVKIKGAEIMLKDQSFYKTSPLGDEAATNGLGANVITHCITGKTYFVIWSMDVKFEGENVDRHLDPTTSNHMSQAPGDPTPTPSTAMSSPAVPPPSNKKCDDAKAEKKRACGPGPHNPSVYTGKNKNMRKKVPCALIRQKIQAINDCLAARAAVTRECYNNVPEAGHANEEAELATNLTKLRDLAAENNC